MTNEKGPTTNTYFGWVCYINWWGLIRRSSDVGHPIILWKVFVNIAYIMSTYGHVTMF